jgi:hypothetical protein
MTLRGLTEEFKAGAQISKNRYAEIFVNPTQHEMDEVAQPVTTDSSHSLYIRSGVKEGHYLRFFAMDDKKLYVFNMDLLHSNAAKVLHFTPTSFNQYIGGIARKIEGRWVCIEAHNVMSIINMARREHPDYIKMARRFFETDWSWVDKYLNVSEFIDKEKKRFKDIMLKEEFSQGVKIHNTYYEIYVNPSVREMDEVADKVDPKKEFGWDNAWLKYQTKEGMYLRFTALPNKKLYVFSPWIIHEDLQNQLGYTLEDVYIHGVARKINGRWTAVETHNIEFMIKHWDNPHYSIVRKELKEFAKVDWTWINKYISISGLLATFTPKIKGLLKQ